MLQATLTAKTPLSLNAQKVVAKRYAMKDSNSHPIEDWSDIVERVVAFVSRAETEARHREEFVQVMREIMLHRLFIPNTPCLVNAGKPKAMLAACFVLPVPDSLDEIMDHAKFCALIHQSGGGTGMTYERLRPAGSPVSDSRGTASGPVSFMQIVNTVTEVVKQGGVRRGANMGILSVAHPDILRFIHAKNDQRSLTNFNISVTVTDKFLEAVENNEWFQTEFDDQPWTRAVFDPKADQGAGGEYNYNGQEPPHPGMIFAPDVWRRIIASTHQWAEPGIIFIDNVNRHNPLMNSMGPKRASNPCAEQMLHDYNACNLGSIDVAKYYDQANNDLDWERLKRDIYWCVRFLDNVVDVCDWPLAQIHDVVHRTRPIGLGIMGFADLLLHKRMKYGSEEAANYAELLMQFIRRESWQASLAIGAEKGVMPEFEPNRASYETLLYGKVGVDRSIPLTPRNYEVTTVAPTGTISLVAETSSGCEPNFSYAYVRKDTLGKRVYAHPLAAQVLGLTFDPLNEASVEAAAEQIEKRYCELPDYFVDAHSLTPDEHLSMLKAFQQHVDNSISKTVNAPAGYTLEDTDRVHRLAWKFGVKAVSYYRDGSRDEQVLTTIQTTPQTTPSATSAPKAEFSLPATTRVNRPRELSGFTWQIPFDGQNLYVTINHDGQQILEVFGNGPLSASVGMLASKMLRGGFSVNEVSQILNKITGTHALFFNQRLITSPEQAVAECLMITQRRIDGLQDAVPKSEIMAQRITGKTCPECGSTNLFRNGGCDTCNDCSWSKCS
ncbi:MAG: adenosylcobalamin-dependent ribonucleoside-diphosphate reductase [Acidobacteria bacterium]|nr:adenosylcobalamin-dependent ribonucleoside-diphosphate reductase [Acidobacteriota bacterium]